MSILPVLLRPFFDFTVNGNFIYFDGLIAEVAQSCLAISAFFLLFMLVFATPDIKPAKRLLALVISFAALFILNIMRMFFLVFIIHKPYFEMVHFILLHLVSLVVVVAIWIGMVKLLKIKAIPFYPDVIYLWGLTRPVQHRKRIKVDKKMVHKIHGGFHKPDIEYAAFPLMKRFARED